MLHSPVRVRCEAPHVSVAVGVAVGIGAGRRAVQGWLRPCAAERAVEVPRTIVTIVAGRCPCWWGSFVWMVALVDGPRVRALARQQKRGRRMRHSHHHAHRRVALLLPRHSLLQVSIRGSSLLAGAWRCN